MTLAQQLYAAETGSPAHRAQATRRLNAYLKQVAERGGDPEASRRAIKASVTRLRAVTSPRR